MQVYVRLLVVAVILVASTESKPTFPDLYVGNYQYPSAEALSVQPHVLQYQDSPYYFYNAHGGVNTIPSAVVANGKPVVPHLPSYNFYYGTPVYDFRIPFNPVYPMLKPPQLDPESKATPPPTTTAKPSGEVEDGIEKLDTKVEPEMEMKEPDQADNKDDKESISIESI